MESLTAYLNRAEPRGDFGLSSTPVEVPFEWVVDSGPRDQILELGRGI